MFLRNFFISFLALFFLFQPVSANAKHYSSAQILYYVNTTPRNRENTLRSLAAYLAEPFDNDYDKAKAIAFWIASRINYDDYLYNNGKVSKLRKTYDDQSPQELIKSRVGICGDFANLFKELCRQAKIDATIVHGYVYPAGKSLTTNLRRQSLHAWNYFIFNGEKIYVDTTFMSTGHTGVKGSQNNLNRGRGIRNIQRVNKKKSQVNEIDEFYFDFSYKNEKSKRRHIRKEK